MAVVAVLCIGVLIGRSGTSSRSPLVAPETSGPGLIRSRAGAVAAAARWLDAVDTRKELLDGPRLGDSISRLVARDAQRDIGRRLAEAAAQLQGSGASPAPTVRSAPLGYRVISFSEERTVIATWEVVARSALDVPASVLWARSQLTLIWQDGWKVSATRVRVDQAGGLTASDMATLDRQYATFRHVP